MKETVLSESLYLYMGGRWVNIPHKLASFSKIKKKSTFSCKIYFFLPVQNTELVTERKLQNATS